jgi:cytochrome c-type protein NapC
MILGVLLFVGMSLAVMALVRPHAVTKGYAFAALLVIPAAAAFLGLDAHVEHSKTTTFCVSCHVMDKHGLSLRVDDVSLLAASHVQSGAVPKDRACFTCHTTYTMYGDFAAKLRGLKHVYVNYFGKPGKLALYEPYHNRECLHCHDGTRRFTKAQTHKAEAGRFEKIRANQQSCIGKGCHEFVHAIDELADLPLWSAQ